MCRGMGDGPGPDQPVPPVDADMALVAEHGRRDLDLLPAGRPDVVPASLELGNEALFLLAPDQHVQAEHLTSVMGHDVGKRRGMSDEQLHCLITG